MGIILIVVAAVLAVLASPLAWFGQPNAEVVGEGPDAPNLGLASAVAPCADIRLVSAANVGDLLVGHTLGVGGGEQVGERHGQLGRLRSALAAILSARHALAPHRSRCLMPLPDPV